MQLSTTKNVALVSYLVKFIFSFCILYFGTVAFIGLVSPRGYYLPFLDHYVNYIAWLRASLLYAVSQLVSLTGAQTFDSNIYSIGIKNGSSIHIVYSCLGYGIMSFWTAFIVANTGDWKRKTSWIVSGILLIWCINVLRLFLLLISNNNKWKVPFKIDHHTLFNIMAYGCIFILIYFFDKSGKRIKERNYDIS